MKTIKFFKSLAAVLGILARPVLKTVAGAPAALLEFVYRRSTHSRPSVGLTSAVRELVYRKVANAQHARANLRPVVNQQVTAGAPTDHAKPMVGPMSLVAATDGTGAVTAAPALLAAALPAGPWVSERVRTCDVWSGGLKMGVIWVYLYPDRGIARRVFKVLDKGLARALGWERYFYPDVPFKPSEGVEGIMDALRAEVAQQLDRRKQGERGKHQKVDNKSGAAPVAVVDSVKLKHKPTPNGVVDSDTGMRSDGAPAKQGRGPEGTRAKVQTQAPVEVPPTVPEVVVPAARRRVEGQRYEGVVTQAGRTNRTGSEGRYETFCLTLHDGKREIPLFGAELERQSTDMGLRPGEKVSVIFMGVQKIGSGKDAYTKNLYQIQRTQSA